MAKFAKHTAVFSLVTVGSRLTGLVRLSVVAWALGGGRLNDGYQLALAVPYMFYEAIMGGLLSAVLIPVLVRAQEKSGKSSAEAWRVANLLLGYVGVVLALISALAVALAPQIIGLMTGLARDPTAPEARLLAAHFFRFFAPQMLFFGISAVLMAILNSHDRFFITAAAPIANNIVVIGVLAAYATGAIGIDGLALGTTLGVAAMALIQLPFVLRLGMPFRPRIDLRDPLWKSLGALGLPVIATSAANLLSTVVRANLLYTIPGAYTAYALSFVLVMMPYGIFAVSIATVMFPSMARDHANGNSAGFSHTLSLGTRMTAFIMLPVALGLALVATPLVRVLFERGRFDFAASQTTAAFLRIYALSILPYALLIFATRSFYALGDTVRPAWTTLIGVLTTITVSALLLHPLGAPGIAVGSLTGYTLASIASYYLLRQRLGSVDGRHLLRNLLRAAIAGVAMVLAVLAISSFLRPSYTILDQARVTPMRLPATVDGGTVSVIREQLPYQELWRLISPKDSTPPEVDFQKHSAMLVVGPRSDTTSTLELASILTDSGTSAALRVNLHADPRPTTGPPVQPSRAHLLLILPHPIQTASVEFSPVAGLPPRGSILHASDLWRLLLLVTVGVAAYFAAAYFLRVEELHSVIHLVNRRLSRSRQPSVDPIQSLSGQPEATPPPRNKDGNPL